MVPTVFLLAVAAHLAAPAPAADTLRTPSGVQYVLRQPGQGAPAGPRAVVRVHYTGFLPNGKFFETSATDRRPLRVRLGRGEVIPGWDELLPLLPRGARVWTRIPARLAYGAEGQRDPDDPTHYRIPPDTDLVFELEIVQVN
ncbi:FKBP-type peptidyl-prolyl cis-trans isomerase [Hymenobacter sp. 15J16-1T3B]|uniref:FKBP-type peptidyl-prolyl cis-trans isomerase n=1 Tax=Hymenobacter sp. 15J16-1T3B TaxID=2886941 RepID=UPI001D128A04|nr:FKBP-type peptidyl-prolyl cis-trans isomerase [Hymenobacter sp. 15J16-1T3B]MCC3157912.1 FKBP-type peptidyl-prolyl cis-trans isomerase [Hymenobacter sp. 15J16-1T3B]